MRVRKLAQGLALVMVWGVSATALHAQNYSVFVLGGGSSLFDKKYYTVYSSPTVLTPYGSTYQMGPNFAAGMEISMNKILGVEGSYGYVRNNLAVTNYASTPATETGYDIRDQRLSGDLVAHVPKSFMGVRPYLVAGLEADRFSPVGNAAANAKSPGFNGFPDTTLSPANESGFNYGGGLEMKVTPRIALRVDVRDHVTGSPTYGLPVKYALVVALPYHPAYYPISGAAHDVEYSAGIVFHFKK